jgi:hypothetical protein
MTDGGNMVWDAKINSVIKRAQLQIASPSEVCSALKDYGEYVNQNSGFADFYYESDAELEKLLLDRNDALINISLALVATSKEVIAALWNRSVTDKSLSDNYRNGLRLAILSGNAPYLAFIGSDAPMLVPSAGIDNKDLTKLLVENDVESSALLGNPHSRGLLRKLFHTVSPFDQIDADRRAILVKYVASNPSINVKNDSPDGPDLLAWDIQKGIFKMLETAPANRDWLFAMNYVLFNVDPSLATIPKEDIQEVLSRWGEVKIKKIFGNKDEDEEGNFTQLSMVDEFRCLIAAIYGRKFQDGKTVISGSKENKDIVLRCAYYGNASMNPEEMQECQKQDGDAFIYSALCNDSLFFNRKCRELLEEMVDGDLFPRYVDRCEQIAKRWKNFDPKPITEYGAALLDDTIKTESPSKDKQTLALLETKLSDIANKLNTLEKYAGWAIAGIIAVLIWKH